MLSYAVDNKPLVLLKRAIDIFAQGESHHHKWMLFCHKSGFQGHKRWNRVQSSEDRCMRIKVENHIIDMFGDVLEPSWDFASEMPTSLKHYLEIYLAWEVHVYKEINAIANELTIEGYNYEAELISSCICDVRKEIEKIRRWLSDYDLVKWDFAYIKIDDHELHNKIKKIEKE